LPNPIRREVQLLPGGEVITIDGTTIPDPETGEPVPAATLRLPAWRATELSAALTLWTTVHDLVISDAAALPTETALARALATTAEALQPTPR
jgi:hypothetical protein